MEPPPVDPDPATTAEPVAPTSAAPEAPTTTGAPAVPTATTGPTYEPATEITLERVVVPAGYAGIPDGSSVRVVMYHHRPEFQTESREVRMRLIELFDARAEEWNAAHPAGSYECTAYLAHPALVSLICTEATRTERTARGYVLELGGWSVNPGLYHESVLSTYLVPGTDVEGIGRDACTSVAPEADRAACATASITGVPGPSGLELEIVLAGTTSLHARVGWDDPRIAVRADRTLGFLLGGERAEVVLPADVVIAADEADGLGVSFAMTPELPFAELFALYAANEFPTLAHVAEIGVVRTRPGMGVLLVSGGAESAASWRAVEALALPLARTHGGTGARHGGFRRAWVQTWSVTGSASRRVLHERPDDSSPIVARPEAGLIVVGLNGPWEDVPTRWEWIYVAAPEGTTGWAYRCLDVP